MKLWIDDVRPAPDFDYARVRSVNEAIRTIKHTENNRQYLLEQQEAAYEDGRDEFAQQLDDVIRLDWTIELIDIDHDAGEYASDGGDYIKLLDWLEVTGRNYPIHIHSMNSVGVANMREIIKRNGWTEIIRK